MDTKCGFSHPPQRTANSPWRTSFSHPPQRTATSPCRIRFPRPPWRNPASVMPRRFSSLVPLALIHPRNELGARFAVSGEVKNAGRMPALRKSTICAALPAQAFRFQSVARLHTICAASPAQASGVGCAPKQGHSVIRFPTFCAASSAQRAERACGLCGNVKNAGRMPALRKPTSNRYTAIRNRHNHVQNQQDANF